VSPHLYRTRAGRGLEAPQPLEDRSGLPVPQRNGPAFEALNRYRAYASGCCRRDLTLHPQLNMDAHHCCRHSTRLSLL